MADKRIRRGVGRRRIEAKEISLGDEIRYVQRLAGKRDGRFVSLGPLALFSTDTGDAWMLDPKEHLAVQVARDGEPEEFGLEENDTDYAVDWKGAYQVVADAFVFTDREGGGSVEIQGYPTVQIAELG